MAEVPPGFVNLWCLRRHLHSLASPSAGSTRILRFPPDSAEALARWCSEIDARIRHVRGLSPASDNTPQNTSTTTAAARVTAKPAAQLGARRASLAVPAAPLFRRFGCARACVHACAAGLNCVSCADGSLLARFARSLARRHRASSGGGPKEQTPFPRVQGYLTKEGEDSSRFYQLTNEYMSYWQDKQAWQEGKAPLGSYVVVPASLPWCFVGHFVVLSCVSITPLTLTGGARRYNIVHFERVTQDGASVWLQFVNGNVRHLVARNAGACNVCRRAIEPEVCAESQWWWYL